MARKPKTYPELDKRRDLLGTVPDATVAELAGTSASIVGRYRRKHGIPAYQGYKFGHDEARKGAEKVLEKVEAGAPLEEVVEVAEEVADTLPPAPAPAPAPTRTRRSKISPYRDQVGKVPDRQIAELAGVTPEAVRMYRRRHKIPLTTRNAAPAADGARKPRRRKSKLDPFSDLLGKVPDAEVAAMAGVTSENVRAYRRRHSIAAEWREKSAAPEETAAPAPVAAPAAVPAAAPAAPVVGAQAFGVKAAGDDTEYVLLGADLASAAQAAQAALAGSTIVAIRHLGPALG